MSVWMTRTLLACFTLALACGDTDAGSSAGAGSTSAASTGPASTGTGTTSAPDTTGAPTTSSPTTSASASSSSGEVPTTGAIDSTSTTSTTTTTTTTTTSDPSTTSTSDPGTSTSTTSTGSSSDGGNGQPPPPPTMPAGCNVCDCCDPWPISWAPVADATHYVVRWKCSINPEQVHDVGAKTAIADVCNDIDMCNGMCAFTVGYIKVQACNNDGCSALVDIPAAPISCGGGCCC